MAETQTPRFGLINWGSPSDGPSRAEFNTNFSAVETQAARDSQGALGSRPAAGKQGSYYWDTDNKFLWRDNGTGWDLVASAQRDVTLKNSAVGVNPLTINAIASTTANLIDAQVSSVSKFSVNSAGNVSANVINGKSSSFLNDTPGNAVIYGKAAASQSANMLTLQDNTGSNLMSVSATGLLTMPTLASVGTGSNTGTVLNANSPSSVAGFGNWSGTASAEFRMNRSGVFNDFVYLVHAVADNTAATRRMGLVMKVGAEDSTGATRSAALYLRSTAALFDQPSFRIDVRDTNMWDMQPNTTGSVTTYPVFANQAYFRSVPNQTGAFNASNTWIGTQNSGNSQYYRNANNSNGFYWYAGGVHSDTLADPGSGGSFAASLTPDADSVFKMSLPRLLIQQTNAVGSSTPAFAIGSSGVGKLQMDNSNIEAFDSSNSYATLNLQIDGGVVVLGSQGTNVRINGINFFVSKNGQPPPYSGSPGDAWLDSRAAGGIKVRLNDGTWQKL